MFGWVKIFGKHDVCRCDCGCEFVRPSKIVIAAIAAKRNLKCGKCKSKTKPRAIKLPPVVETVAPVDIPVPTITGDSHFDRFAANEFASIVPRIRSVESSLNEAFVKTKLQTEGHAEKYEKRYEKIGDRALAYSHELREKLADLQFRASDAGLRREYETLQRETGGNR